MFAYTPLNSDHNEIRLVRPLCSAPRTSKSNQTSLELSHVSLNDTVSYAALSYIWGDAKDIVEIKANGYAFNITRNLDTALQQFRASGIDSWLWIDAICIDQSNDVDKSSQIIRMNEIFSRANVVYMWLGPGCIESDVAMDFISLVGPKAQSCHALELWDNEARQQEIVAYIEQRVRRQDIDGGIADESELGLLVYGLLNNEALQTGSALTTGIRNILQRDYWHRVWVVQEVVSACEVVVITGTRNVSLASFDSTLTAIWFCIASRFDLMQPKWKSFGHGLSRNLYKIKSLDIRRRLRQNAAQRTVPLVDILWELGGAPERPYYTATDPRDILFGLLGIIPEGQLVKAFADYTLSVAAVFALITRLLISYGDEYPGSFHLDCCDPGKATGPLPSWAPDWRQIGLYGGLTYRINHRQTFHATGVILHPVSPVSGYVKEDKILRRLGCRVDVITKVMQPPEWNQRSLYDASWIKNADSWFRSIRAFVGLGGESGPGEDYVWRTVMRNELHKNIHLPRQNRTSLSEATLSLCRKIMRLEHIDAEGLTGDEVDFIFNGPLFMSFGSESHALNDQQVESFASLWREVLGTQNRNRTLFKTAKGMLGLGHLAIEPGDVVTLIWGVSSPIILGQRGEGGFYFHGDAYVDGIMQGEYLETKPVEEEFCIY